METKPSKCLTCCNAYSHKCVFHRTVEVNGGKLSFIPVKGWNIKITEGRINVLDCPNYESESSYNRGKIAWN